MYKIMNCKTSCTPMWFVVLIIMFLMLQQLKLGYSMKFIPCVEACTSD